MIAMPIMNIETSVSALSSAVDPLARWAGPAFGYTTLEYGLTIGVMAAIGIAFIFRKYNIIVPEWIK